MSPFAKGDRVRLVQVTLDDRAPITDPADPDSFDWYGRETLIGKVGTVTEVYPESPATRNEVRFDHLPPTAELLSTAAFPDADLAPES